MTWELVSKFHRQLSQLSKEILSWILPQVFQILLKSVEGVVSRLVHFYEIVQDYFAHAGGRHFSHVCELLDGEGFEEDGAWFQAEFLLVFEDLGEEVFDDGDFPE